MGTRTEFEVAQTAYSNALDAASAKLNKLAGGDLQKAFGQKTTTTMADAMKAVGDVLPDVNRYLHKLNDLAARPNAACPDFARYAAPHCHQDFGIFKVADKGGEFAELPMQRKQPAIDPAANVADAMLARRFQGGQP
jgi:hypothetical protein